MPEVRVQDEQGTVHVFPDGSTPEMIAQVMNVKPPRTDFSANPPSAAGGYATKPPQMQQVDIAGKPQNPAAGMAGVPGGSSNPQPGSAAYRTAVGLPIGAAAAYMGGSAALPFLAPALKNAVKAIPSVAAMEGINYARHNLPFGKYIPAGAEWLPMFMHGGGGKAEAEPVNPGAPEPTIPAEVQQAQPLRSIPPTGAKPVAETGEALGGIKPNLPFLPQETPAPRITQKAVQGQLEKGLGYEPPDIKPGQPIGQKPKESSAVESHHYDPQAREFHVQPKSGNTGYIYGDVSPEDAQAFQQAESKGKAWQQMRNNPLVGKVVNGQRVDVKPPAALQSADPQGNNLTDLLTRSVQQAQEKPPQFAYRARPVGEQGVPAGNHAQATTSLSQAAKYAEPGQQQPGAAGEVVRVDLSKLSPKDYVIKSHPSGAKWVQFTRPLAENEVEPVGQAAGQKKNVRPVQGK